MATAKGTPSISFSPWLMSDSCPGVRISFTGSPSPLTPAWILVPNPPRLRPSACSAGPPSHRLFFGAGGVGVGADDGGVEDEPLQVGVLQGLEDPLPGALLGPAVEAPPHGVPVAEALGEVAPGGAGLGDPQDGVEEEPVVPGGPAGLAGPPGQPVLDPLPVGVRDRMAVRHDRPSVAGAKARLSPKLPSPCPHDLDQERARALPRPGGARQPPQAWLVAGAIGPGRGGMRTGRRDVAARLSL